MVHKHLILCAPEHDYCTIVNENTALFYQTISHLSCPAHCLFLLTGSLASIGKAPLADLKSGLATAPTLFAAEEFPQLRTLIGRKFEAEGDIELAVNLVSRSQGKGENLFSYMLCSQHEWFLITVVRKSRTMSLSS